MSTSESRSTAALWAPGVRLMGNISFPAKALIISLVFLLPVLLLGYFFVSAQNEQIAFSTKERLGVTAFKHVMPVSTGLLKVRNVTRASIGGLDGASRYRAAQQEINAAIQDFEKYVAVSGDPLGIKPDFERLKNAWVQASKSEAGMDAEGRTVFGPITAAITKLIGAIGDNSNLALDPDMDSYYLFSALYGLSSTAENTGQLWGWGTYALAQLQSTKKELEVKDLMRYAVWAAGLKEGLSTAKGYLDKVIGYNPSLKARLDLKVLDDVAAFHDMAKDASALQKNDKLGAAEYFDKGQTAVLRLQSFYDKGLPVLDELLAARISGFQGKLKLSGVLVMVVVLIGAYLFYSFFLVTSGGLNTIKRHLEELAQGDLAHRPARPAGSDETAQVMGSFITVHGVLGKFQQAQAEMARQHDAGALDYRISTTALPGSFAAMAQDINTLVESHIMVKMKIVEVVTGYSAGKLDVAMDRLPGQKARISEAMDKVQSALQGAAEAATFNERIRRSLDSLPVCVTVSNAQAQLVHATPAAKQLLALLGGAGFDADTFYGNHLSTLFRNPKDAARFDHAMQSGETVDMEVQGRKLRLLARPVHNDAGEPIGRITQWLDRTEEIAAENQIDDMVNAATRGNFNGRLSLDGKTGFFAKVSGGMNQLMETCEQGLGDVTQVLSAVAKGDLTQRITRDYQGLFGQVKDSVNASSENLTRVIGEVRAAADSLTGAASQVSATAQSLSQAASEQAASVEQTSSQIDSMSASDRVKLILET